jgi:hypothetical protein
VSVDSVLSEDLVSQNQFLVSIGLAAEKPLAMILAPTLVKTRAFVNRRNCTET